MDDSQDTVKLLRGIWNEMKALNGRIDKTNARLDQTNTRLEQTNNRLEEGFEHLNARIDQTNLRLERGFGQVNVRIDKTNARLDHLVEFVGERWREHSRALLGLDRRLTRLEARGR